VCVALLLPHAVAQAARTPNETTEAVARVLFTAQAYQRWTIAGAASP
jgi:hypothetical protein